MYVIFFTSCMSPKANILVGQYSFKKMKVYMSINETSQKANVNSFF